MFFRLRFIISFSSRFPFFFHCFYLFWLHSHHTYSTDPDRDLFVIFFLHAIYVFSRQVWTKHYRYWFTFSQCRVPVVTVSFELPQYLCAYMEFFIRMQICNILFGSGWKAAETLAPSLPTPCQLNRAMRQWRPGWPITRCRY